MNRFCRCALLLLASALLAACSLPNPYSTYQGVNLIAADAFGSSSTPSWQVGYSQTTAYSYLVATQVSAATAGTTAGLPSSSATIYRLEVPNLVANGDFENNSVGSWTAEGATLPVLGLAPTEVGSQVIDGSYSLYYAFGGGLGTGQWVSYPLNSVTVADGFVAGDNYRVLFAYNSAGDPFVEFDYDNGTNLLITPFWQIATNGNPITVTDQFPDPSSDSVITAQAPPSYFTIGQINQQLNQTGDIDDFRVVRADIDSYFHLAVPFGSASGSSMTSGIYQFTVYVKLENPSQVTPTVQNAFNATGITLGMNGERTAFLTSDPTLNLSSTQWEPVTMKATVQLNPYTGSASDAIDLYISPYSINNRDCGRILVSSPSLQFLPNG